MSKDKYIGELNTSKNNYKALLQRLIYERNSAHRRPKERKKLIKDINNINEQIERINKQLSRQY